MVEQQVTYGFARKRLVPPDGGKPKLCPKCDLWFSAQPRERICQACRPNYQQARMVVRKGPVKSAAREVGGTRSDALGITFRPGIPLWRQLALEAAAQDRWSQPSKRSVGIVQACEPNCRCEPCLACRVGVA